MSAALLIAVSAASFFVSNAASDPFDCFLLFPNHFLEKSGSLVIRDVVSTSVCLQHCLLAQKINDLQCRSAMWRRNSRDCILSRWSVSQRPYSLKISQKTDVDLYENICSQEIKAVYSTNSGTQPKRTTTVPSSSENFNTNSSLGTTHLPLAKIKKDEPSEFRRFRAHHARSVKGTPLPAKALHVVDGESAPPPLFTAVVSTTTQDTIVNDRLSGGNTEDVKEFLKGARGLQNVASQIDDTNWVLNFGNKPIRPGRITPHSVPRTTVSPRDSQNNKGGGTVEDVKTRENSTTSPLTTTTPFYQVTSARPTPCFTRTKGNFLPNFEERTLIQASVRQCLLNCLNSSTFFCASANYFEAERTCVLNGGNVRINRAVIVERNGWDYFENKCHLGERDEQLEGATTTTTMKNSKEEGCFESHKNMVMASLDAIVIRHLKSADECLAVCQKEKTPCSSLNWIPNTNGCMLFYNEFQLKELSPSPGSTFYVNKCNDATVSTTKSPKDSDDYYD